jgi:AraC family L-rhamnose operon transcriptional activator RhaR
MDANELVPRHRFTDLNQLPISLRLGGYASEILGWGFLGTRWWRNYLHIHSFYEVCYAFEGEGVFRMNGVEYPVRGGDVFVAKPSEPHEIISSHEAPLGIYFWSYTLVPSSPVKRGSETRDLDALLRAFTVSQRWVSDHVSGMQRTLELLTEEIVARETGYHLTIEHLTAKLLIDTARAVTDLPSISSNAETSKRDPMAMLVQRIEQYLRDNYSRPISIRDVAAQVHLSERHTSRLFRKATGASIKDRLTTLRIEAATQLLLNGRLAIKDVGAASGFPDVQHFTTIFRRRTGLTPAAFRERGGTNFIDPSGPRHVEE